ncbi:hypothetical protein GFH48_00195 [Streptomyces fagopyri]|uniref:Uncharacterized protein n=1 Tax=Streptomyces fagopyri TaxID=2662397 RepID=A0A5Q0LMR2_9ACTN|nr:hypothetical protein GFH48_00195 [Streptomyces fagopyri]
MRRRRLRSVCPPLFRRATAHRTGRVQFDPADSLTPWYDVSCVDAVAAPVTITPNDVTPPASGERAVAGCAQDFLSSCPADDLTKDPTTGQPLVCVNPNRDAETPHSDMVNQQCPRRATGRSRTPSRATRSCTSAPGAAA